MVAGHARVRAATDAVPSPGDSGYVRWHHKPKWRNGRRSGFKIRQGYPLCGFKSHLRYYA